jgi:hypothetical protein
MICVSILRFFSVLCSHKNGRYTFSFNFQIKIDQYPIMNKFILSFHTIIGATRLAPIWVHVEIREFTWRQSVGTTPAKFEVGVVLFGGVANENFIFCKN